MTHVMRNPYLIGEKVYLRAIEEADAAVCHEWVNDPEVRRFLNLKARPHTEASTREFVRSVDWKKHQVFAIVTRADGIYIGNCGLHGINYVDRRATLGIVIGRKDWWEKGCGTDAVRLLCRHAFETLNLHKVCLTCFATNERGFAVYKKVGFKPEARRRDQIFVEGRHVDEIVMGLLRGELMES